MTRSYFWTMLCLILHQVDAAYWREWEMFHVPGGIQGFLIFNLAAIALVLAGYRHVLLATAQANYRRSSDPKYSPFVSSNDLDTQRNQVKQYQAAVAAAAAAQRASNWPSSDLA